MADNRVFALSVIAVTLFAAAASHAAATAGQLCCTSTGNCPGQGVGGAQVQLNCIVDGEVLTFSRATTNSTGSFVITPDASMEERICGVVVNLPLEDGGCRELSAADKGILLAHFQPTCSFTAFKKYSAA